LHNQLSNSSQKDEPSDEPNQSRIVFSSLTSVKNFKMAVTFSSLAIGTELSSFDVQNSNMALFRIFGSPESSNC
jgi:hypothetical protein